MHMIVGLFVNGANLENIALIISTNTQINIIYGYLMTIFWISISSALERYYMFFLVQMGIAGQIPNVWSKKFASMFGYKHVFSSIHLKHNFGALFIHPFTKFYITKTKTSLIIYDCHTLYIIMIKKMINYVI